MKPNLFIVSSAIYVGNEETPRRFLETIGTLNSIISNNPNNKIVVLENSSKPLNSVFIKELEARAEVFHYGQDPEMSNIDQKAEVIANQTTIKYNDPSINAKEYIKMGYLKNKKECYAMHKFLSENDLSGFGRIFKMSGRYILNNEFEETNHIEEISAVVRETNQPIGYMQTDHLCYTTLYSFDPKIQPKMINVYQNIIWYMDERYELDIPVDIEHGLHKFTKKLKINKLKRLGVMGITNKSGNSLITLV